ncbi:hypothetical protein [Myxococcus sp. SDU36]|uniref:hypothetical protein n=1 Tax=Myxococcus sp. SDU36 TaxID=2831967 RepID=UPI002542FF56|nr:hypothetical protein [Myxococcus sp. SDU36]WIG96740.1 hypothetical protein KGD87_04730 [Myxococcus sp. SDU36]
MKPGTTDAPVVVYHDLESWAAMLVLDLVALVALIVAHVLDMDLAVFGVFAYCILGSSAVIAVVGRRRIEMDPTGIRVYRRGRLRLQRSLSSFSRLKPLFAGTVAIVFDDGAWTWIPSVSQEGTTILDFLSASRETEVIRGPTRGSNVLEMLVTALRFPAGTCVGCNREATTTVEFSASSGWDFVLVSWGVSRTLRAPACGSCRSRRKWLFRGALTLPALAMIYVLPGPWSPAGQPDPLRTVSFIVAVSSFVVLRRWGDSLCDWWIFGLWGFSLSRDTSRVRLRVRDPGLRHDIAGLARSPGTGVAAVDAEGTMYEL